MRRLALVTNHGEASRDGTGTMTDRAFICYARNDQDWVLKLAADLKHRGISVWLDRDIDVAEDWDQAIDAAIRECTRFLLVLTPSAVASDEVRAELRLALDLKKPIVPVLYQECTVPRQLRLTQYVDFSASGDSYDRRLEHLALILTGERPPPDDSDRLSFLTRVELLPDDARAFDSDFTKPTAIALSKRLSDKQFLALHDLRLSRRPEETGIVKSEAIELIGSPSWEAEPLFAALTQFGFLALSADRRERDHPDPGYDYTPLFWGFTNLMRFLRVGRLAADEGRLGAAYWLSSRTQPDA